MEKNVKNAFKYSNDQVSIAVIKKDAFLYYINFGYSKKKIYLKYNRKKIILSSSFKLSQFKAIFPNSYKNVSGLPVTPFERVAGVSLIIKDENKKSYLNFTFYDGTLSSIIITNNIINYKRLVRDVILKKQILKNQMKNSILLIGISIIISSCKECINYYFY